jgi:hypothetical protein
LYGERHGIYVKTDAGQVFYQAKATLGVSRAGQLLIEMPQAKAVMYALLQYPAQFAVTLDNGDFTGARFRRRFSGGKPGRPAADDGNVVRFFIQN